VININHKREMQHQDVVLTLSVRVTGVGMDDFRGVEMDMLGWLARQQAVQPSQP
jgi:hypothetical protein